MLVKFLTLDSRILQGHYCNNMSCMGRRVYRLVVVSLVLMAIVTVCCDKETIEEERLRMNHGLIGSK